jgi:hypothetical protein
MFVDRTQLYISAVLIGIFEIGVMVVRALGH